MLLGMPLKAVEKGIKLACTVLQTVILTKSPLENYSNPTLEKTSSLLLTQLRNIENASSAKMLQYCIELCESSAEDFNWLGSARSLKRLTEALTKKIEDFRNVK